MPTDELAPEKRIADELSIPESPPVHPEEALNDAAPDLVLGHPPWTRLLLEGVAPDEITAEFLVDVHDLADEHGLTLDGISARQGRNEL